MDNPKIILTNVAMLVAAIEITNGIYDAVDMNNISTGFILFFNIITKHDYLKNMFCL